MPEEGAEHSALRDVETATAIARADRRDDHVALAGEPERGVAEFDQRKDAARLGVDRDTMVHDHQRKRTFADGVDHIGEDGDLVRKAPDLFL